MVVVVALRVDPSLSLPWWWGAGCQCLSPIYRRRGDNKGAGGWIDELCLAKDNTNK